MDRHRLAVVIPAHRERSTIGLIVEQARRYGTVLVIDDASPDDTGEVARKAGAKVFRIEQNCSYDGALSRGFDEAARLGFRHVVTMDADGEHDPHLVAEFRRMLRDEGVPLVLGYRRRKQRIAEVIMGSYVRVRWGVRDILCGMKGYDLELYRRNGGFDHTEGIGTELAINSLRRGVPFAQIPVTGVRRRDKPRFDRCLSANFRILTALVRVLRRNLETAEKL